MLEILVYGLTLACFGVVIIATARMPHELMLVGCIPPVFVAIVMGFVMAVYAGDTFGLLMPIAAVAPSGPVAWHLSRRYRPRDLMVAIYLAWVIGMVFALIAVQLPDAG